MPIVLEETVVSTGGQFHGTRAQVPDYLRQAIAESVERAKEDARVQRQSWPSEVPEEPGPKED